MRQKKKIQKEKDTRQQVQGTKDKTKWKKRR